MLERISRHYVAILLGLYAVLCFALALRLSYYPSQVERADAWGYINHALELRNGGLLGKLSSWRTYGYVWFLYFCSLAFGTDRSTLALCAGLIQAGIYAASVLWLSLSASRARPWRMAILVGLLLNPILVALVLDTLTESMTLILAVLLVTLLLKAGEASDGRRTLAWLATGSALAAFSLMVRPANLPILVAWNVAVLPILWEGSLTTKARRIGLYGILFAAVAVIVWLPQLIITSRHFGAASIFPASSLGNFQMLFGIKLLKYATRVEGDLAAGLFYPNPWLTEPLRKGVLWQWYLQHPIAGMLTVASHVFNALNYDHPFVYVYDYTLPNSALISFAVWFVYALGITGVWVAARHWLRSEERRSGSAIAIFLLVTTLLTFATISISAVESRFSTLLLAALGTFAANFVLNPKVSPSQRIWAIGLALSAGTIGTMLSEWMKDLVTTVPVT
jgi:hypothetical protein